MESSIYNIMFPVDSVYYSSTESRAWMSYPELRLLWAIIERAARDAMGNNPVEREAASTWFLQPFIQKPEEFSFQWICETLETDPNMLISKVFPELDRTEYKLAC